MSFEYKEEKVVYTPEKLDAVYIVKENVDRTEGRGGMRVVPDSGFFLNEDEAWDFADTIGGIMCGPPADHGETWRNQKYPHVEVVKIPRHDSELLSKKRELLRRKKKLEAELNEVQNQLRSR